MEQSVRAEITLDERKTNKCQATKETEYDADIEEAVETEIEPGTPSTLGPKPCHQEDPQEARPLRRRRSLSQDETLECRESRKRSRRSIMI